MAFGWLYFLTPRIIIVILPSRVKVLGEFGFFDVLAALVKPLL
jgi:hypothetical protein